MYTVRMSNSTLFMLLGLVPAPHTPFLWLVTLSILPNVSRVGDGGWGGGVLDQYLGIGEPLRARNPDPI